MKLRYEEKSLSRPQKILQWILESQFSPLTCLYFSTTVQASFIINSKPVDQNVKQLSACFGRLRQLCDQISDVQEDIIMGNATVPVLYALAEGDQHLGQMIKALWRDIRETESNTDKLLISQKAAEIKELTQELGGLRQAYELADTWYQKAIGLTSECSQTLGVNTELALLIRLKRAYLERLRLNNWSDIPGYY
jgi:geranylgeranyl pyrophosphate synthase